MANQSTAFGFRQIGGAFGAAPTYEMSVRAIQSTSATVIGFGDVVGRANNTSPYITVLSASASTTAVPVEGIFVGCQYQPKTGGGVVWSNFWPGAASATDAVAYVIDSPEASFLAASSGASAITAADIGKTVNFTTGGGTTSLINGVSPMTVDQSTLSTSNTALPFKVVGIYGPAFGNFANNAPGQFGGVGNGTDPTTPFNWVVVSFNNQIRNSLSAD